MGYNHECNKAHKITNRINIDFPTSHIDFAQEKGWAGRGPLIRLGRNDSYYMCLSLDGYFVRARLCSRRLR